MNIDRRRINQQCTAIFVLFALVHMIFCNGFENDESSNLKVKVELYYMPQCPGCRQLITTSLNDAFSTPGFSDMADVTFVSYGNIRASKGTLRIFDNVLESCALDKIEHQDEQFHYINCIDHSESQDASQVDVECAKIIGLSEDTIKRIEVCAATAEGHILANKMVEQSTNLTPEISYYPWIVVNNVHNIPIENEVWSSLFKYTCKLYKGSKKSQYCPGMDEEYLIADQL